MAMAAKQHVGIVGAGRMGLAMLKHLVKHGHPVTVCDLSPKQCEAAQAAGADITATPAEVGRACDFVIIGSGTSQRQMRSAAPTCRPWWASRSPPSCTCS